MYSFLCSDRLLPWLLLFVTYHCYCAVSRLLLPWLLHSVMCDGCHGYCTLSQIAVVTVHCDRVLWPWLLYTDRLLLPWWSPSPNQQIAVAVFAGDASRGASGKQHPQAHKANSRKCAAAVSEAAIVDSETTETRTAAESCESERPTAVTQTNRGKQGKAKKEQKPSKKEKKIYYIVFVGNLPYTTTVDDVRKHFQRTGQYA